MNDLKRFFRHFAMTQWRARRMFSAETLKAIEQAVATTEAQHGGEIRFVVEAELSTPDLIAGVTPRARALQVFGELGVWDTEQNNGVLVYVLLADHDVEIVADRGYTGKVTAGEWAQACLVLEHAFKRGEFERGSVECINAVGGLIARHYPAIDRNELPNQAVLL